MAVATRAVKARRRAFTRVKIGTRVVTKFTQRGYRLALFKQMFQVREAFLERLGEGRAETLYYSPVSPRVPIVQRSVH